MTFDWWTLGLQTVNVVILIWILAHFLFRPVSQMIAERQAAAHAVLQEAEAAREKARSEQAAVAAERANIAAERNTLIAAAQDAAEAESRRLLETARSDVERLRGAARTEIIQMRKSEAEAVADQASHLATDIVARLLERLPDSARIDGFIEGLGQAVQDLPESTRADIGLNTPVLLRAARMPSEAEQKRLTEVFSNALNRPVELRVQPDPSLLAGLELDAPHAIVTNHFRADLDRITKSLTRDD
jgi:F-type H+-transporting ATPase subunit b